jgi:hypothetical protein
MGANQNSLRELSLCPKVDLQRASLLAQSRPHSFRKAFGPRNRVRQTEIIAKTQHGVESHKPSYDNKNRLTSGLTTLHIFHQISHMRDQQATMEVRQELRKSSNLRSGGSRKNRRQLQKRTSQR